MKRYRIHIIGQHVGITVFAEKFIVYNELLIFIVDGRDVVLLDADSTLDVLAGCGLPEDEVIWQSPTVRASNSIPAEVKL